MAAESSIMKLYVQWFKAEALLSKHSRWLLYITFYYV
ncbi:hypothetical protein SAMN05414139_09801 [Burkholderia sp. D7]|jgi:hypothetical protein|nr:hypothetical protein SAMN05414139_02303 [Burkholderia sp. D7]SOE96794.1 hypothetical protein SAMN05414139_09801 [Burkholderia sp. D7]